MKPSHFVGNFGLSLISRLAFDSPFRDSQSGMWVFRRSVWDAIDVRSGGMAFSQEIKHEAYVKRFRCAEEPIDYGARGGEVKLNALRDGAKNAARFLIHRTRARNGAVCFGMVRPGVGPGPTMAVGSQASRGVTPCPRVARKPQLRGMPSPRHNGGIYWEVQWCSISCLSDAAPAVQPAGLTTSGAYGRRTSAIEVGFGSPAAALHAPCGDLSGGTAQLCRAGRQTRSRRGDHDRSEERSGRYQFSWLLWALGSGMTSIQGSRGCSSVVEHQLPKLTVRVRFPSPAPTLRRTLDADGPEPLLVRGICRTVPTRRLLPLRQWSVRPQRTSPAGPNQHLEPPG